METLKIDKNEMEIKNDSVITFQVKYKDYISILAFIEKRYRKAVRNIANRETLLPRIVLRVVSIIIRSLIKYLITIYYYQYLSLL